MSDEGWEKYFKAFNDHSYWRRSAERLKHSADILFSHYQARSGLSPEEWAESEDSGIAGIATLLYGLAMENVLKAVLLKDGVVKADRNGNVPWKEVKASDHNLVSMSKALKSFSLSADQEKLMERMSAFVCWAGKYPTPLKFKDSKPENDFKGLLLAEQPNAGKVMLPVEFREEDKKSFDNIFATLRARVLTKPGARTSLSQMPQG